MAYKFVTREEIKQYWKDYPDDKSRVIVMASFVDRLLSERDAIRKVGLTHFKWRFDRDPELQNKWDGKTTTEEDFDGEVCRLLEKANEAQTIEELPM